ncbi:MAG: hypothetical protein K2N84_07075, partial [Clostridia bacterium]|nr:hypothetical protein [Clostridia bacterium]
GTGGGLLLGLIAYPVRIVLSAPGAYVVFSLLTALALFYFLMGTPLKNLLHISRKQRVERKEEQEEKQPETVKSVKFDELSAPERTPAPASALRAEPQPDFSTYRRETTMSDARRMERDTSREILYSGERDRADDYLKNLIFSRDSQFNQRTVQKPSAPETPAESGYSERTFDAPASKGYSERYARQAETARPSMPRRVVPAEKTTFGDDNFNYPQTPTYRAPSAPLEEENRDVPPAPAAERIVFRNDEASEPVRPAFRNEEASAPVRPAFRGDETSEPARPAFRNDVANEPVRPTFRAPEEEKPAPVAPAAPARENSRDLFRSAFSRRDEDPFIPSDRAPEEYTPAHVA